MQDEKTFEYKQSPKEIFSSLMYFLEHILREDPRVDCSFSSIRTDEYRPNTCYDKIKKLTGLKSEMEGEILRQGRILLKKEKKKKYKEIPEIYINTLNKEVQRFDMEIPEDVKKEIREYICRKIDMKYKDEMGRLGRIFD